MRTRSITTSRITTRAGVAAAAVAVMASFAAAPAAQAATTSHPSRAHKLLAPHTAVNKGIAHVGHHKTAPKPDVNRHAGSHPQTSVTFKGAKAAKPARPARPAVRARGHVALWSGTPSYTLGTNHASAAISGISAGCHKVGNVSGTWSPSPCPNGYEVTGDIKVPVGQTLTIAAGTVVYFDTTVEGALGVADPSELPDLLVNGTLKVVGTTANPVTLTSANATPNASVEPEAGDWGYVFFNHTGAAKGGGSITGLRLLYGEGIAADRVAPKITHSLVRNIAAGTTPPTVATSIVHGAGIDYENVPGGAAVTFDHLTFDGAEVAGIEVQAAAHHTDFAGADPAGHHFSLNVTNSSITGGASSGFEDTLDAYSYTDGTTAAANAAGVTINVHNNTLTQTANGYEADIQADSNPTTPGTAAVTGAFHDNTLSGGDSSYGLYLYAYANNATATGTKTCLNTSACVIVPLLRDTITAEYDAVDATATVNSGAGKALTSVPVGAVKKVKVHKNGHTVTKLVDVPGGYFGSEDDNVFYLQSYAYGTGTARVNIPIVKSTLRGYDYDVETYAEAYRGTGSSNVTARHTSMSSYDEDNIYPQAYGSENAAPPSGKDGSASSNVAILGGKYYAYDYNIDADEVASYFDRGTTRVAVKDAKLIAADDTNIYSLTYSSYTGGSGGATGNVSVDGSQLQSYYGNIQNEVYAYHGTAPASGNETVTGSTLSSYDDDAVDTEIYSAESSGSHGAATQAAVIKKSQVHSYYDVLDLETYSYYGGSATSNPKIIDSNVTATDDYAIENDVTAASSAGSGSATGNPLVQGSTVNSYYTAIYNDVYSSYGHGNTVASPKVVNSRVNVGDDNIIDNYGYTASSGTGGSATGNPVISGSTTNSYDAAIYNDIYAYFGAATANPRFVKSTGVVSDDYGIENEVYSDYDTSGSATTGHAAIGNPVVDHSSLSSYYDVIYNEVYSYGGSGTGNPVFNASSGVSYDDYGIENDVYSNDERGTGGTATGNPRITGGSILTAYYYVLYNDVNGDGGPAVGNPVVTGSRLTSTDDDVIDNDVYSSSTGTGRATGNPVITGSVLDGYDYGLYNYVIGYNGGGTGNPVVTGTKIKALYESSIYNYVVGGDTAGAGTAIANPKISSSALLCSDCSSYAGLENEAASQGSDGTANPVVTGTTISSPDGYGIENDAYAAEARGSGTAIAHPTVTGGSIAGYYEALYNYASGTNGNSPANASFTATNPTWVSTSDDAVDVYAASSGTAASTINPAITGGAIRAPYDIGIFLEPEPTGSGASHVGGSVTGTTVMAEEEAFEVDRSGSGPSTFSTTFNKDKLISTYYEGIYASYATGSAASMTPHVTNSTVTANYDNGIELALSGTAVNTSDVVLVAPVLKNTVVDSYDGISLTSGDSSGAANNGKWVVGGSMTGGSVLSGDDDGIFASATCTYCSSGAKASFNVTNTPIEAYDDALHVVAESATNAGAGAVVAGKATSTTHSHVVADDGDGVYAYAHSAGHNAVNSYSVNGLHVSGYTGGIASYALSDTAAAAITGSITNNVVDNTDAVKDEYGIYEEGEGGTDVTRNGAISGNKVVNLTGSSGEGIYGYYQGAGTVHSALTAAHNTVNNIGSYGIDFEAFHGTAPASGDYLHVLHNTVARTGYTGLYLYGFTPTVTANVVHDVGTIGGGSYEQSGIYVDDAPLQGSVTCNVIYGNAFGVDYGTANPTAGAGGHNGDPKTNNNAFRSLTQKIRNSTDLRSANTGSDPTDAQNNFWGGNPRLSGAASGYDVTPKLSKAPKCTSTAGA